MPSLLVEAFESDPNRVAISSRLISVGRASDNDISVTDDLVSAHHMQLRIEGDEFVVVDCQSTNGTFVNGERVTRRALHPGDEITVGHSRIVVLSERPRTSREEFLHGKKVLGADLEEIKSKMDSVGEQLKTMARQTPQPITSHEKTIARPAGEAPPSADSLLLAGKAFRRLEAIYDACKVTTTTFHLEERIEKIMDVVLNAIGAKRGFLLLLDDASGELKVRVARGIDGEDLADESPSMTIANRAAESGEPVLVEDTWKDSGAGGSSSILTYGIRSAMCVPLVIEDKLFGSIYADNAHAGGSFTSEDLELFAAIATQSAIVIQNSRLYEQTVDLEKKRSNLQRYLSPSVVEQVLETDTDLELGGTKKDVSVLFCDIRNFTPLAERIAPTDVVVLLNEYFTHMTDLIFLHRGTLDKYIGDEFMAVFGAPLSHETDALNAVLAAIDIRTAAAELCERWREQGRPMFEIGIGVSTGEAVSGNVGSPNCMGFTVIGDRVNTGRRLCDRATPGQVLICETTAEMVADKVNVRPVGELQLEGKESLVMTFEVVGRKADA